MGFNSIRRFSPLLLATLLAPPDPLMAFEFSGRLSALGSVAQTGPGELGYLPGADETLLTDRQSARLMLDGGDDTIEWSLHLLLAREHLNGLRRENSPVSPFRYRELANNWRADDRSTSFGHELDRALYKQRFDNLTLALGRQPIDWGSGRFWQPLNLFGAFAPTALDTDYKPGIDAAGFTWYPSPFSSLTSVYVPRTSVIQGLDESAAVYYRGQVGELSELSLLGGKVLGNRVLGWAFESAWGGMGWRVEGAHYRLQTTQEQFLFWIAGVDYQFSDGTLIAAEWYDNAHGAASETQLAGVQSASLVGYGLQPQLGERLLGLTLERDITPLLHGGYTLLAATLKDARNHRASSLLHQFNLVYSLSNESDLLCSLLATTGKGLNDTSEIRSEFGHLPATLTLRVRFYY